MDFPLSRRHLLGYDEVVESGLKWTNSSNSRASSGQDSTGDRWQEQAIWGRGSGFSTGMGQMFRGNHPARVDEKGRLKLPAEFKRQIDEQYGVQFYITSRDGKVAEIHPMPEWEKFEEKLAAIPSFNPAKKKLLKWLNYFGQQAEMDGQGRVLLPQILREKAKLTGEVVVYGSEKHLEISNREDYEREMQEAPMTDEDEAALADLGL